MENLVKFNNKSRPKKKEGKDKKKDTYESPYAFYEGWELTLIAFKPEISPIKATQDERLIYFLLKKCFECFSHK